ncbi:CDP-diacylglycerol--serine O-phosphatidyltransferase [Thermosinus carboxydivorans Nor1]|uniref:CDP-diacylglycerol--serine O-phosphatidyltransferase n=1 Tax=Thermosinus carboxydivorans Nor1 TaxID=401526 RepID=A1HRR6_9FIRM|nr:CDP-diacylglycerol--serine O-phosphatidyltransferase [Thermosinus carboxydivorans]EAX47237.1 CDP-diacylglycerol--serine O-phosphatidyltransferase [Thermosinus carboxydivorans Nor1]
MSRKWIPNLLAIVNLFAGLLAIMLAFTGNWTLAAALILGAALFDNLDGRVARRLNATSEFGKELDSLADLVSFGVAPATIDYMLNFSLLGWSGYLLAALFPICGALRLARFNSMNVRGYFVGLPITVAGPVLAGTALFGDFLPVAVQALVLLVLSGLMVSTLRVPKW